MTDGRFPNGSRQIVREEIEVLDPLDVISRNRARMNPDSAKRIALVVFSVVIQKREGRFWRERRRRERASAAQMDHRLPLRVAAPKALLTELSLRPKPSLHQGPSACATARK